MTDNITETAPAEATTEDTELASIWKEIQTPAEPAEVEDSSEEATAEPAEVEPVKEVKEDRDSKKLLFFKKKDQEFRQREMELKQRELKLHQEFDALQRRQSKKSENLYDWLADEGVSPDDIVKAIATGGKPVDAETKALKERLDKFERLEQQRLQETQQAQVKQAADVIVGNIQNSDRYDLINEASAHDLVINTILDYHNNGQPISWSQAADLVESELQTNVERLLTTKKGRTLLEKLLPSAVAPASNSKPQAIKQPAAKPTKTISQTYDTPKREPTVPNTPEERARIIELAMKGEIDD